MGGNTTRSEENRTVHKILVGKPEGMRPFETLWCRCVDNIRIDIKDRRYDNIG
jgi:hypothetical protein